MPYKLVYYIDSSYTGGAEEVLFTVLNGLDRKLWRPVLFYHQYPGILPFIRRVEEINVETISVPTIKNYTDIKDILIFVRTLRAVKPQIFHANLNWPLSCTKGIVAAYLSRVKFIVGTQHLYQNIRFKRRRILQRAVSHIINCYIVISRGMADQLKKDISDERKIRVVYNGIIIDKFANTKTPDSNRKIFGISDESKPIVLCVARLDKQKGHYYLINAFEKIQKARLILVGDGPERANLETQVRNLNLQDRVTFLGKRENISELVNACDLFVQASLFEGGVPLSILEAMVCGKPVITTDIPVINERLINSENALLVPPENSAALATAINSLLSDSGLSERIAASGKNTVLKEYSAERMVSELCDIYEELIQRS